MRAPGAAVAIVALVAHGTAGAEVPEPPPRHWLGMSAVLVPSGTLTRSALVGTQDDPMAVAYGLALVADRAILPNLSWMLAPRILRNIGLADAEETSSQLDLRLGMRGHVALRPQVEVFGYGAGGYSIVFLPDYPGDEVHPQGLLAAAGLGVSYRWTRGTTFSLSLGYQLGFQKVASDGDDAVYKDRLLDVTVGFLAALD